MTKRKCTKSILIAGLVVLLSIAISMTAFAGGKKEDTAPVAQGDMDIMDAVKAEGSVLNIYDWAEWWPQEIYDGFSEEHGIKIVRDNFASIDDMVTKFKLNPDAGYDITLPDTRGFVHMKELGLLQELNHAWLPNAEKYLPEATKNAFYDPGYKYSIATDVYFVGPVYNSKYVDENDPDFGTWKWFFTNTSEYSGKITLLDTMYNVIGAALISLGYSYNSDIEAELNEAKELLMQFMPHVMAFDSWPKRVMLEEEAVLAQMWIGETWFLHMENEAIEGVLPSEGTVMGVDVLVIPNGAKHPAAAHLFMDYILRTEINALLITTIGYGTNHTESSNMLPEEMKTFPGVNPSDEYLSKCEYISPKAYTGKGLELREKIWEELRQ